jgi:hypothetical protein
LREATEGAHSCTCWQHHLLLSVIGLVYTAHIKLCTLKKPHCHHPD